MLVIVVVLIVLLLFLILFLVLNRKISKIEQENKQIKEQMLEYENQVLKSLVKEYALLDEKYMKRIDEHLKNVDAQLEIMKNEKQKLSVEEAIILLQKQDSGWFDKHFAAGIPAIETIANIVEEKFASKEEKYQKIVEEIRQESEQ